MRAPPSCVNGKIEKKIGQGGFSQDSTWSLLGAEGVKDTRDLSGVFERWCQ